MDLTYDNVKSKWFSVAVVTFGVYLVYQVYLMIPDDVSTVSWLKSPLGLVLFCIVFLPMFAAIMTPNNPLVHSLTLSYSLPLGCLCFPSICLAASHLAEPVLLL